MSEGDATRHESEAEPAAQSATEKLDALGVRGILWQLARDGQILDVAAHRHPRVPRRPLEASPSLVAPLAAATLAQQHDPGLDAGDLRPAIVSGDDSVDF